MFSTTTLVSFISLVVCIAATPISDGGFSIPLQKRAASLTNPQGTFDAAQAARNVAGVRSKYQHNLKTLKSNVGPDAFSQLLPGAAAPAVEKRQAESLTDIQNDLEWAGTITVGGQKFTVDFDTGSSDLWIPSKDCKSSVCSQKNKYSPMTGTKKDGTFQIQYGDGSTVSGPIYTDSVSVAGVSVKNQYFSPVTTLSDSFGDAPVDGLLGLAFPAISNLKQSPFFNTAVSQGAVKTAAFSFYLASQGSELYLGGSNSKLYTGSPETHKVSSNTGFWLIGGGSISANGKKTSTGISTIIDSGTTLAYGPPAAVKALYAAIPGSAPFPGQDGFYQFPCAKVPKVSFNWGGKDWAISAKNFNLGTTADGASTCVGAVAGQDLGLGDNVWLLGDSFMKNVYTSFSFSDNSVSFAALKQ